MVKIENVANKLFHNDVTNIVTFTNYSGDSEKSKINVQGFVKDPSGKSFTRLTSLITALNEHPNFSGASVRSFSKSEDADGYFKSTFNLEFVYTPDQIETEEPEMAEDATTAELEGSINESSSTLNDEQELTEFDSDGLDVETIESVETSGDSSKEEASPSSNASDVVGEAAPQANQVNGETPKTTAQESQEVPVSEGDAAAQVPAENSADAQIEEFELESKANTLPLRNN
jgi:hypothetical protein